MLLVNVTRSTVLAGRVQRAGDPWSRLIGFLFRRTIAPDEGRWFPHCSAIHTVAMWSRIDVVLLDAEGCVLAMLANVPPGRLRVGRREAAAVLEMGPGFLATAELEAGDQLALVARTT